MKAAFIIEEEARRVGVETKDLVGKSRTRTVVQARHAAMIRCRRQLGMSLHEVGKAFGRDHSTVVYVLKKYGDAVMGNLSDVRLNTKKRKDVLTCEVPGCEWSMTIDEHHETNIMTYMLCPNHHSLLTRKKATLKQLLQDPTCHMVHGNPH